MSVLQRIVSGGQTGVDRAALDAALEHGLAIGGWCPQGRRAEDGPIDIRYPLTETESRAYHVRTRENVVDSDGTLILHFGSLTKGTSLTRKLARQSNQPSYCVDLSDDESQLQLAATLDWILEAKIRVLNIAGPRESTSPGIYELAKCFVTRLLHAHDN